MRVLCTDKSSKMRMRLGCKCKMCDPSGRISLKHCGRPRFGYVVECKLSVTAM